MGFLWRLLPILISLILGFTIGCGEGPHSTDATQVAGAKSGAQGGADGSGGVTGISSPEQVEKALDYTKTLFLRSLKRLSKVVDGNNKNIQDRRFLPARMKLIQGLLHGTELEPQSAIELLEKNLIQWNLNTSGPCDAVNDEHADGAAQPRKICISVKRLTRFAFKELKSNLLHLVAHEFGHLYFGKDEIAPMTLKLFLQRLIKI